MASLRKWIVPAAAFFLAAYVLSYGAESPWRRLYEGEDATGEDVVALWQFRSGGETVDASGGGHDLDLRGGSRFVEQGVFGSCLESFAPENDDPHGARAARHPDLTPEGAFVLELWVRPKPEFFDVTTSYLIDQKYADDQGYQLLLRRSGDGHRLRAGLGYGEDSDNYQSDVIGLEEGEWSHIAFTYNGEGTGRFFLDGDFVGDTTHEGRGSVAQGRRGLVIGDRLGSRYLGFAGYIDQVRILSAIPEWLEPEITATVEHGRSVFERMEEGRVTVTVNNPGDYPLHDLEGTVTFDGVEQEEKLTLRELGAGESAEFEVPVNTGLKPGEHIFSVDFQAGVEGETAEFGVEEAVTIVPRRLPYEMPVAMMGFGDTETLGKIGFTHSLLWLADHGRVWEAGEPVYPVRSKERTISTINSLDERLAAGQRYLGGIRPGRWVVDRGHDEYRRIDRDGKKHDRVNVCGLFPEVQDFCYNVGKSVGQTFGRHPAFDGLRIHTEVRDGTRLCFHDHDTEAYREYSGRDIPEEARSHEGIPSDRRDEFVPGDGIICDDHPILDYYRWFWREGDGWNELHSRIHRGYQGHTHENFWGFFHPAVRCPPIWGSGGEVDVLSQWTYTYPDPLKIGLAADELFAMAEGRPGQDVMKMTQIIWYRRATAPDLPEREEDRQDWEREEPEARFITISPDHLREAFWLKIARPVQGIMYHGIGSLVGGSSGSYRYTNPETREALAQLVRDVVRPLGPSLMQIPDAETDVAILESFTSDMFGAQGTRGWGRGWIADMHHVLQWARLQPRVMYEDTILRDGLDGIEVLVMPNSPVLPESVYEKIQDFQAMGGIIVGDDCLAPAIVPDIYLSRPGGDGTTQENKEALQELAGALREELSPVYDRAMDSSCADIIVRRRSYGDTDYLFAINDRRTFGDYVGRHGLVMEDGVAHSGTVWIDREGVYVYDLLQSRRIATEAGGAGTAWDVSLGPGGGGLFMITGRPVESIGIGVAARGPQDRGVGLTVTVADGAGDALDAVVPVRLKITDPTGQAAEFSGYYGARDGVVNVALDLAENDEEGTWTVYAVELASGQEAQAEFEYRR